MRTGVLFLVGLSLLLGFACGGGYDCSQEEYARFEQIYENEGLTAEVEEWIEECGSRFT